MKNINWLIFIYLTFLFLSGCAAVQEGFSSNKKKDGSDAFLVEKKAPLVMPPDFNELPLPKQPNQLIENKEETDIKSLLTNNNDAAQDNQNAKQNTDFENSIIEKIKNN